MNKKWKNGEGKKGKTRGEKRIWGTVTGNAFTLTVTKLCSILFFSLNMVAFFSWLPCFIYFFVSVPVQITISTHITGSGKQVNCVLPTSN